MRGGTIAEADVPMATDVKAKADRIMKADGRLGANENYPGVSDARRRIYERRAVALALLRVGPVGLSAGVE
jgi:hypothetical protein